MPLRLSSIVENLSLYELAFQGTGQRPFSANPTAGHLSSHPPATHLRVAGRPLGNPGKAFWAQTLHINTPVDTSAYRGVFPTFTGSLRPTWIYIFYYMLYHHMILSTCPIRFCQRHASWRMASPAPRRTRGSIARVDGFFGGPLEAKRCGSFETLWEWTTCYSFVNEDAIFWGWK